MRPPFRSSLFLLATALFGGSALAAAAEPMCRPQATRLPPLYARLAAEPPLQANERLHLRQLAAMVARAHNGGNWKRTYDQLTTSDAYDYVKNFIGTTGHKDKGDWNAIRCTESFGKDTLTAGKNGRGIGGLQMTPLTLP